MTFPNVPDVPGVPPLLRAPGIATGDLAPLLTGDSIDGVSEGPQWGIFKDDSRVVTPDSVISFEFMREWQIATYPLEKGAFESYDKVQTPFEVRFRLSKSGSQADRTAFISELDAIVGTTERYDAVTPERTYTGVNITHYDYRRSLDNGARMFLVDVWAMEIREDATATFTNVASPGASNPADSGVVQPTTPTPAQQQSVGSSLGGMLGDQGG